MMCDTNYWPGRILPLLIAIIIAGAVPVSAQMQRAEPQLPETLPRTDPDSFLLVIWTRAPLDGVMITSDTKVLPRAEAYRDSPYITAVLPRLDTDRDGRVRLRFPAERRDVGEWGIYLLPGWQPSDIRLRSLSWVRQQSLAFREGSGALPLDVEFRPRDAGEWVMYYLPGRAPEDLADRPLSWLRQQSTAYREGSGTPPDGTILHPGPRTVDERIEDAAAERELPASMRFAMLPRFGMNIFHTEDLALQRIDARSQVERANDEARREDLSAASVAGQAVPPSYIIGPGDELAIRVWTQAVEHISVRSTVSTDGTVYLALLGEVTVGGRSLADVREMLTEGYHRYFDEVQVSVALARTRTIEVRVTGDAQRPGKYRLSGAATVFSALYAAGGPSEIGSMRGIKLIRRGEAPRPVDLYAYLIEGDADADVLLEPEDTILIPPAGPMIGLTGEVQRAARYELNGETTVREALAMAGGLTGTGDARRIQVWRIAEDGQRRLLNVDSTSGSERDFTAHTGDLIVVEPVLEDPHNIVEVTGGVTRPGSYQFHEGMTVRDLLTMARGITPGAHTGRALVWRLNDQMKYEHLRFNLAEALNGSSDADVSLRARDQVVILLEDEVEAPREVEVAGPVRRPGVVVWREGMQISDLVALAGGLTEGAYTPRANILRLTPDQKREIIPVRLGDAIAGNPTADLRLARGDMLEVLETFRVAVEGQVQVGGFVNEPERYRRYEGMRVSDAILAAGGLAPGAGTEIQLTSGGDRTQVEPVVLTLRRNGTEPEVYPDPILSDNDLIAILGQGDMIGWPSAVSISGRVARPGTYAVEANDRAPDTVYDLLTRAGGMLPDANPNGIVLYRLREEIIAGEQSEDLAQMIMAFNREMTEDTVEAERQREAGVTGQVAEGLRAAFAQHDRALIIPPRRLSQDAWARAVPIDGQLMMETGGEQGNFDLVDGDVVVVPTTPSTVTLMGAVVRPGALAWRDGLLPADYVNSAGGPAPDAQARRTVVIRANGSVEADGMRAEVRPGDIILVPSDYMIKEIARPSTLDRIISGVTGALGAYLLFR